MSGIYYWGTGKRFRYHPREKPKAAGKRRRSVLARFRSLRARQEMTRARQRDRAANRIGVGAKQLGGKSLWSRLKTLIRGRGDR